MLFSLLKNVVSKLKRDWHKELRRHCGLIELTIKRPLKLLQIPYFYGVEDVLLIECQIPSFRSRIKEALTEKENVRLNRTKLKALDEKIFDAQQQLECIKLISLNKRVQVHPFQAGYLIQPIGRPIITNHKTCSNSL